MRRDQHVVPVIGHLVDDQFGQVGEEQTRGAADDINRLRVAAAQCAAVTATDPRGWGTPLPLSPTAELPTFPLWAFPEWLGQYAAGVAEATQTPHDLAGCLALAVLAVAAGGKVFLLIAESGAGGIRTHDQGIMSPLL